MVDYHDWATKLRIVDVWKQGNETGYVTPRCLYDPSVPLASGRVVAPTLDRFRFWIDHDTEGTNTLPYFGGGGTIAAGTYALAHYLVPHEQTVYADGHGHDTTYVVFKMVPPHFACNNVGNAIDPVDNTNTLS